VYDLMNPSCERVRQITFLIEEKNRRAAMRAHARDLIESTDVLRAL
jgi:hypothetical protein